MEKIIGLKKLQSTQFNGNLLALLIIFLLQLCLPNAAQADFTNGGFEDTYTPGATAHEPINGWELTGYTFNGNATNTAPTSMNDIGLGSTTSPGGITDIYDASNPSNPYDYFLLGAAPAPITLTLPGTDLQSASINFRSGHAPFTVSGTTGKPGAGWTKVAKQATSMAQQLTIQSSDFDPVDNKVHIRFIAAPVLENAGHAAKDQPFFAIQLNNLTTDPTRSSPLFFQWNFAGQPGAPWKNLTVAGTNVPGSNISYKYTDWQAFDIAPGNAFIHDGDNVELVALASGCSQNGHDGHVYLDDVTTAIPSKLWVYATGPASTTPGTDVTYTYHYTNGGNVAVNNVTVVANLPQGALPSGAGQDTTYVSNTNPTIGTAPSCSGTAPVTCNIGTLQPGQSGTFTLTVHIPADWVSNPDGTHASGPVNNGNYPISGDGVTTLLGPLVQTALVAPSALSNLVADTSGMPATAIAGVPYTGNFTCANTPTASATGDAPNASCDITNLPAGLAVSGCTITPGNAAWTQPDIIPANETVTCDVTGTPSSTGSFTATVSTNASNNSNSTSNTANAPITVGSPSDMVAAASLPGIATLGVPYTGSFTCTNSSTVTATAVHCAIAGLPTGVTMSSCTSSPGNTPWVDGSSLAANQVVTCDVSGTPTVPGSVTATVTTSASNQPASANDTATAPIAVGNPSNMTAAVVSLPANATSGVPYTGSFTCTNSSAVTATSAQCGVSGLPAGLSVSGCTISPSNAAWTQPAAIPAGETVTCAVTGTPTSTGPFTATVTTGASNQTNTSDDTVTAPITVGGASDMVATSSLPAGAALSIPYTGSFTCTNNSAVTATSVSCGISGLPNGLTVTSCSSPTHNPWVDGSSLPAHQAVTCTVSGTPVSAGSVTATVTTSASNQTNTANDTVTAPITVGNADMVAAASLPATASAFSPYKGSFTCTNNSAVTAVAVQCAISGLPKGVTVSSCSSPTHNPWVNGSPLPPHQTITCRVSGTPQKSGNFSVTVKTSAGNQTNTSNDIRSPVIKASKPTIPATLKGSRVLNASVVCCGRPVILHNLPGPGKTTYRVTARSGNASCVIGRSGSQTYLKMRGSSGSCTITGTKNGVTTLPLTIRTP